MGRSHQALGNRALAREHYQHGRTLYTDLGMSEADQIRAHLTAVYLTATPSDQQ